MNDFKHPGIQPHCAEADDGIWGAVKLGDIEAFAKLYKMYFDLLSRYGRKIFADEEAVKDCIHDLFVEIWKNRLNLAAPQSVKAYLLCSLKRKMVRRLKKKEKERSGSLKANFLTGEVRSKEDQLISEQNTIDTQIAMNRAIKTLTRRQQEAVYLKFYHNLSYSEISLVMEIGKDSVYNLISKAIDVLQKQLQSKSQLDYSTAP